MEGKTWIPFLKKSFGFLQPVLVLCEGVNACVVGLLSTGSRMGECLWGFPWVSLGAPGCLWGPWPPLLWQRHFTAYPYRCTLADFQIEKKIGRGQFSEVYRATCLLDRKPVALKKVQVSIPAQSLLPGWLRQVTLPSSPLWVPVSRSGLMAVVLAQIYFRFHPWLYGEGSPSWWELCETARPRGCASATRSCHPSTAGTWRGKGWSLMVELEFVKSWMSEVQNF